MVLQAEQAGGWEVVPAAGRDGVELVTPKRAAMIVRLSPAIEDIMAGAAAAEVVARHG